MHPTYFSYWKNSEPRIKSSHNITLLLSNTQKLYSDTWVLSVCYNYLWEGNKDISIIHFYWYHDLCIQGNHLYNTYCCKNMNWLDRAGNNSLPSDILTACVDAEAFGVYNFNLEWAALYTDRTLSHLTYVDEINLGSVNRHAQIFNVSGTLVKNSSLMYCFTQLKFTKNQTDMSISIVYSSNIRINVF